MKPFPLRILAPGRRIAWLSLVTLFALAAIAQHRAAKRPLTHKDSDGWRAIQSAQLSRDGKFLAYGLFPQDGDGELVVRELATGKERREPAGSLPPPPELDFSTLTPGEELPQRGIRIAFTADSRFLVASTFPSKAETEKARKERRRPDQAPKGGLVVIDLASAASTRLANVKGFQTPWRAGSLLVYQKEAAAEERPPAAAAAAAEGEERRPAGRGVSPRARGKKEYGTDLALRHLTRPEPNERVFMDVSEYSMSRDGQTLAYAVSSRKEEENGAYAVATASDAPPAALLRGKGAYTKLTWDRRQARLAFLSDRDDAASKQPRHKLYLWDRGAGSAAEIVSASTPEFRPGWILSDRGTLGFSRDGARLFFGANPPSEQEPEAAPAEERVVADLWHWKDEFIQPMQKVRAARERARSFRGVYHIAEKRFVQLGDPSLAEISPSDDGRYAIGGDDRPYRSQVDFDGRYEDHYLVDTVTGQRKLIVEKLRGGGRGGGGGGFGGALNWAPDGGHVVFFRDRNWHSFRVSDGVLTNLTSGLGVHFYNEDHDTPDLPDSYGSAGWTRDGRSVLLYDRFDVWQVSGDGRTSSNVTDGQGRRSKLQFRVARLEPEDDEEQPRGIDPAKPLLLRAENIETRDSGFWRDRLDATVPPQKLILAARSFRTLGKARDADVVLMTTSTFQEFPDLQVTDSNFRAPRRASDANPQKSQLSWGTGELVRFQNADGVPLQAALFKPENFDPSKKYPLMVYIYERLSQQVHQFVDPRPGSSINRSYYVSNGYLVLMPDIVYSTGSPGQSALRCVLPAIQAVVNQGFVDENAIGIQGHSWGGYQISYLVTQTRRFRAAAPGAPVGNMTSAYNGIRWGSGLPRQWQYEKAQSRIGGSLWQYPLRFLENSPIFMADRVQTPLLILHDDEDDAVPWYQGIELFLSLRQLGKEVYLFNYNGEKHGLRQRRNQKDYTVRLQQFFDHFLKGAPKPEWMEKGIPYLEREREKERLKASTDLP